MNSEFRTHQFQKKINKILLLVLAFMFILIGCGSSVSEDSGDDNTPPTIPTNVDAQAISSSQINLSWTASTDNVGVTGYRIYRDGTEINTSSTTSYTDTGLTQNTFYSYTISAYDAANNASAQSTSESTTTLVLSANCSGNNFSFAVFSDNYSGQEGGLRRIFNEMHDMDPNIHFLTSAGDTPSYERVRNIIDTRLTANDKSLCGATAFPWFPATGNHDSEVQSYMDWWATNWADGWTSNPAASRLATQLPGVTNFQRGPLQIETSSGLIDADHGTMYSFDYKNAHFVFIDNYEQGIIGDSAAGVWDENGAAVFDPATSQLDWLQDDLEQNTKHATFMFGHVALLAPCYNWEPPSSYYDCPGPPPPGWSEHNSNFHTNELTQLLADHNVIGFFHGHDHVPSRMLINGDRTAAFERKYWEVANDPDSPIGTPSDWENLQGPGTVWQVDAGRVYTKYRYLHNCQGNRCRRYVRDLSLPQQHTWFHGIMGYLDYSHYQCRYLCRYTNRGCFLYDLFSKNPQLRYWYGNGLR